ncbi:MAG TPA: 3-oxoacyl-ACP reductase FabG [Saprospiraceae bacterium]|nr:3-oxoacyl-ACP reductase FabG [Saprospiraceae bacterium]
MSLKGKIAIVTGGSNGIGKATIHRLIEEGAVVVNFDINAEKGTALSTLYNTDEIKYYFYALSTADSNNVQKVVSDVIGTLGRIDILVNNAGILRDASLLKMTDDQWSDVINVNLTGVYNCTRIIAPHMVARGSGKIINLSSVVALYGNFGQTNYTAAKAGVIAMTKTWARELGRKNINVNAIAPGFIQTDILKDMPEEVLNSLVDKVPLKRMGTVEDVANLIYFLASAQSDYINGAVISIDGGATV